MNKLKLVIMKQMEEIEQLRNKYIDEAKKVDKYKEAIGKIKEKLNELNKTSYNATPYIMVITEIYKILEEIE